MDKIGQKSKNDFINKSALHPFVFLIFGLVFCLGVLGVWLAPGIKQIEEPMQIPPSPAENKSLESPSIGGKDLTPTGDKNPTSTLPTDNCFGRQSGSVWQCDELGKYDATGKHYCRCTDKRTIEISGDDDIKMGNICVRPNGCFGRNLGTIITYQCDETGYFNTNGSYICSCGSDCAVIKFKPASYDTLFDTSPYTRYVVMVGTVTEVNPSNNPIAFSLTSGEITYYFRYNPYTVYFMCGASTTPFLFSVGQKLKISYTKGQGGWPVLSAVDREDTCPQ